MAEKRRKPLTKLILFNGELGFEAVGEVLLPPFVRLEAAALAGTACGGFSFYHWFALGPQFLRLNDAGFGGWLIHFCLIQILRIG